MYHHILVALDHSDLSHTILEQAIALAQPFGTQLTLLHILSSNEVMSPTMPLIPIPEYYPSLSATTLELYQEKWAAFEAQSLVTLEHHRAKAQAAGLEARALQRSGNPGATICEAAKDLAVDLIVMGRRGHSGLSELLIGSVSNYVVHHAACAVLVCNANFSSVQASALEQEVVPSRGTPA